MSYTDDRSERVIQIFEAAVMCEPRERPAYLRSACADDPEVRRQVETMLAGNIVMYKMCSFRI